jgi:hypothetical protein
MWSLSADMDVTRQFEIFNGPFTGICIREKIEAQRVGSGIAPEKIL